MKASWSAVAFIALLIPGNFLAAVRGGDRNAPTPAWQWTNAERLAARFDQAKIQERVTHAMSDRAASQATPDSVGGASRRPADVIDGKVHPELFLPHELFDSLIKFGFILDDEDYRADVMKHARGLNLPADFWDRLKDVSTAYIEDLRLQHQRLDRARSASRDDIAQLQAVEDASMVNRCADRAAALAAAHKLFGQESLDRLLYEYVAPSCSTNYVNLPERAALISAEEGCK